MTPLKRRTHVHLYGSHMTQGHHVTRLARVTRESVARVELG